MNTSSRGVRYTWLFGLLAIIASIAVNIAISVIARTWLGAPSTFAPLGFGPVIFWSVFFGIGATLVFALVARWSKRPGTVFVRIALIAYACTFIPDLLLLQFPTFFPGSTLTAVLSLMAMHALEAIIVISTFVILAARSGEYRKRQQDTLEAR